MFLGLVADQNAPVARDLVRHGRTDALDVALVIVDQASSGHVQQKGLRRHGGPLVDLDRIAVLVGGVADGYRAQFPARLGGVGFGSGHRDRRLPAGAAVRRHGESLAGIRQRPRFFGRHGERRPGRSVAREVNLSRRDLDSRLAVFFAGRERQQQDEAERMPENADHL